MRKQLKLIICTAVLFTALSGAAHGSVLHGKLYDWSTFARLDAVIVEINTTPRQKFIAENGEYAFNVPKGSYAIEARYYKDNVLEYFAEENITLPENGDFVLDIIMFPALFEEALFEYNESEITVDETLFKGVGEEKRTIISAPFSIAAVMLIIVILIAFYAKKMTEKEKHEAAKGEEKKIAEEDLHEPQIAQEMPGDLNELVDMILQEGGRTTQHELREKLRCSEAKLSLMLADLEDRGIIKKIKKGRGNIIVMQKQEEKNE